MNRREIHLETAPPLANLPRGYFGGILVDAAWRFKTWSEKGKGRSAEQHYPTMTMDELRALDVAGLAARDSVLFLWAVWPMLPQALALIEAWGFKYKTCGFCWTKADASQLDMFRDDTDVAIGTGYWTRANTEPCLLATRGQPRRNPRRCSASHHRAEARALAQARCDSRPHRAAGRWSVSGNVRAAPSPWLDGLGQRDSARADGERRSSKLDSARATAASRRQP